MNVAPVRTAGFNPGATPYQGSDLPQLHMGVNMRIETREYFNTHGQRPRGRGNWWFAMLVEDETETVQEYGTYTEASRRALERAREIGAHAVHVLP
jgi:hypothetical protein